MNFSEASLQSLLAQVSYAKINTLGSIAKADNRAALSEVGLTDAQIERIVTEGWNLKAFHSDATGANLMAVEIGGKTYLAVGGTVPSSGSDLFSDLLLALGAPAVLNPQYISIKATVESWLNSNPKILEPGFTIAGHSLGGYLAAALKSDSLGAGDTYMFNAPAVGGVFGGMAEFISQTFGISQQVTEGVYNIQSSEGPSVTAGLGYDYSPPIVIQSEVSPTSPIDAHSIAKLTDALNLQTYLSLLLPSTDLEQINSMSDYSAVNLGEALDGAIDALRRLVYGPSVTKIGDSRQAFYVALADEVLASSLKDATVVNLAKMTADQMVALAQQSGDVGAAARRALLVLSSFGTTKGVEVPGYSDQPPEYWQHRAEMLANLNWFNETEMAAVAPNIVPGDPANDAHQELSQVFIDAATGFAIQQGKLYNNTPIVRFGDALNNSYAGLEVADYLFGGDGADTLKGGGGADHLFGDGNTSGIDVLYGEAGDDQLYGGAGIDLLSGGMDNDTLMGGNGDDRLEGGWGSDAYIWRPGEGSDRIVEAYETQGAGFDVLKLVGVNFADVRISHNNTFLTITYMPTNETLWIEGWYGTLAERKLDQIEFADRILSQSDAHSLGLVWHGGEYSESLTGLPYDEELHGNGGDDSISGNDGDDLIYGDGGNDYVAGGTGNDQLEGGLGADQLYGHTGDDSLVGGQGADRIHGGAGNDLIIYRHGDGLDTILFDGLPDATATQDCLRMEGFQSSEIKFQQAGNDLIIENTTTNETLVRIEKWYQPGRESYRSIDRFEFSDGYLTPEQASTAGLIIVGTAENDTLNGSLTSTNSWSLNLYGREGADLLWGGSNNDYLEGGLGDDRIHGAYGDDTYRYNFGDGYDTLSDAQGNDTVDFGAIAIQDVIFKHAGVGAFSGDLIINLGDGGVVHILSHYAGQGGIENFILGGNTYSANQIEAWVNKAQG